MTTHCPNCGHDLSQPATLEVDITRGIVADRGITVSFSDNEMKIVDALFRAQPRALSDEHLFGCLYSLDADRPEIAIIKVIICHIRKKLKALPHIRINAVWGRGYALEISKPVEESEHAEESKEAVERRGEGPSSRSKNRDPSGW